MDDKGSLPPQLVERQQFVEIGPAVRTETPDGDEAGSERRTRNRHDARRDVMNATRDYDNGSISHEELDEKISQSRYKIGENSWDSPMTRQPKPV